MIGTLSSYLNFFGRSNSLFLPCFRLFDFHKGVQEGVEPGSQVEPPHAPQYPDDLTQGRFLRFTDPSQDLKTEDPQDRRDQEDGLDREEVPGEKCDIPILKGIKNQPRDDWGRTGAKAQTKASFFLFPILPI